MKQMIKFRTETSNWQRTIFTFVERLVQSGFSIEVQEENRGAIIIAEREIPDGWMPEVKFLFENISPEVKMEKI